MSTTIDSDQATRVCASDELAPGEMRAVSLGRLPAVVIRLGDGSLHALVNRCLHQGAPLSSGRLGHGSRGAAGLGDYRADVSVAALRCPWHGYEYDVRTGCTLFDPSRRLRRLTVWEEDGSVLLAP
ncbi:MAG TPA: Rieske (2Fe-2S) protein [Solirubrobacteraceae bacterium]|jgi:nitrite reductase/ring-hydroxylating ferredoxin subunit|nr:Rieske (2Fe-2S) protein [Solirubrobacteraceae bacterium]